MTSTVFLDTETTGLYAGQDEVVQIGIIDEAGQVLMDVLVRPERMKEWPEAQAIHGISPENVVNAPTLAELMPQITEILRGKTVVIYNAGFDTGFLPIIYEVAAQVHCCMLAFADHYADWNEYSGSYRWQKLSTAARYVWHDLTNAHNAVADAQACRAVHRYLTDDGERMRVNALREQRRIEREAQQALEWAQQRAESDLRQALMEQSAQEARDRRALEEAAAKVIERRVGLVTHAATQKARRMNEYGYARLFFGLPLPVIEHETRRGKPLDQYTKRTQVPDKLKRFSFFKKEPVWLRDALVPDAYIERPDTYEWYYDVAQIDAIRARYPLRRNYSPPKGLTLVTRTHLKRTLKLKDDEIAKLAPVVEVETKYQGWIFMYEVAA